MGFRETLQEKKGLSTGLAVLLVVLGVGGIAWQLFGNSNDTRHKIPNDFFTVDDGQSYFTAPATNNPPFDYKGQEAVKAVVYECGGKKFVAYMFRLTPEARKIIAGGGNPTPAPAKPVAAASGGKGSPEPAAGGKMSPEAAARAANPAPTPIVSPHAAAIEIAMNGYEFKRPGDKEWVRDRGKVMEIKAIRCPNGGHDATPVLP